MGLLLLRAVQTYPIGDTDGVVAQFLPYIDPSPQTWDTREVRYSRLLFKPCVSIRAGFRGSDGVITCRVSTSSMSKCPRFLITSPFVFPAGSPSTFLGVGITESAYLFSQNLSDAEMD